MKMFEEFIYGDITVNPQKLIDYGLLQKIILNRVSDCSFFGIKLRRLCAIILEFEENASIEFKIQSIPLVWDDGVIPTKHIIWARKWRPSDVKHPTRIIDKPFKEQYDTWRDVEAAKT
ncbi:hypothetical protein Pfo_013931 [Paulownia fortunei]|nr:hypothetical protein Pfo_013931 [Paulownia fortunei]